MTEQDFIKHKMPILIKEGYSRAQAYAISKNMYSKNHAQQGKEMYYQMAGTYIDPNLLTPNINLQAQTFSPQQDFSVQNQGLMQNYNIPNQNVPNPGYYDVNPPLFSLERQNKDTTPTSENKPTQENNNTRYNVVNPYGGYDLESTLSYTGQQFGQGNFGMGIAGAGLSILKGARNFLSGYASGKENQRVRNEYFDNLYADKSNYGMLQQGGKITNADMFTGQFIVDEGQGNTNIENDEFVKRASTGEVQQAIGEPHIKNGKKADGIDVTLNNGDKVLSNYTKIPAKDVKELKERYQLSLKKGATFADAQKAFDKKIGIHKVTEELSSYIEKLGKNENVKDETAKRLNELALTKEITEYKDKLDALKDPQSMVFEDLFSRQEKIPKLGSGDTLFDSKGKEVKETNNYQQGGSVKPIPITSKDLQNFKMNDVLSNEVTSTVKPIVKIQPGVENTKLGAGYYIYSKYPVQNIETDREFITTSGMNTLKGTKPYLDYLKSQTPDKNNYPSVTMLQEGGIYELAKKHDISPERAMELINMQQGGDIEQSSQNQMQQIFQAVVGMLQEGQTPDQIIETLIQNNIPHEQSMQIVAQVVQQMQGQSPQEEQIEGSMSNPQEEQIEVAQQGIRVGSKYENPELYKKQEATSEEWSSFGELLKNNPKEVLADIKEKHPELYDKYFKDGKIPSHGKIGEFQDAINDKYNAIKKDYIKTYGEDSPQVKELENYIEADKFLPQELKSDKGTNTQIRARDAFLGNYTSTRPNFAINVLPKEELEKVNKEGVNTAWELKQKFPDLYKQYVGDKGLESDFWLGQTTQKEVKPVETPTVQQEQAEIPQETTENVLPWLPQALRLSPSSLDPIYKSQINLPRQEPIKMTVEPYLAEQERQRLADISRAEASGLSPQQMAALSAQGLATSQLSANDAINKVETFNAQNQFATDQFNLNQRAKEDITNEQFAQSYQDKVMQSLANQEAAWRNYYQQNYLDQNQQFKDIENINLLNAQNDQYQYIPGVGVKFLNNKKVDLSLPSLTQEQVNNMTPEQYNEYVKNYTNMVNAKKKYGM